MKTPDEPTSDPTSGTALKRGITAPLLYLFILGDVLGAGVYALIGELARRVGGMVWLPLLVALGMAMLTAASYAELVTRYPRAGGAAVYADEAFGRPLVSFLVGFCMLAAGVTSAAGLSLAFAGDYLGTFLDVPPLLMALVFLGLVAALNARGIQESLGANVLMTVTEMGGLLLIIGLGAWVVLRGAGAPGRVLEWTEGTSAGGAVLGAALIAFYSFVGFETSANLAEEVRDVRRVYPRALFGALITAGVLYVLVALAAVAAVAPGQLAASSGPLLEVVKVAGGVPPRLFAVVALIAVANGGLLTMIMASRLAYGMAEQGLLPAVFGRVLPGRRTPWVAILATTLVAMALTVTGGLADLAETVVLLLLFVFISTNAAVLVLRRRPAGHEHFRVWAWVPPLAIVCCVVLLTRQSAATWMRAGGLLVLGGVLYLPTRGRRAR